MIIIAGLDGSLSAVEFSSGKMLWSFSSGDPVVSRIEFGYQNFNISSGEKDEKASDDGEEARKKETLFPGADGSLYLFNPVDGVQAGIFSHYDQILLCLTAIYESLSSHSLFAEASDHCSGACNFFTFHGIRW